MFLVKISPWRFSTSFFPLENGNTNDVLVKTELTLYILNENLILGAVDELGFFSE